jgi:hypothetical protein
MSRLIRACLFGRALLALLYFDLFLRRGDFKALHDSVRQLPIRHVTPRESAVDQVCAAVDLASIWYWKQAPCLQRSAAAVWLLRREGVPAQMVIGAQQLPFRAHAWVEVDGLVVNDKPYLREMYGVVERC